jgi:diaminopimelate decarboxylase
MNHFEYRENALCCEDVPMADIAAAVGTPVYVYSAATLKRHFQAFDKAFFGKPHLVCYSAKANANLAILSLFAKLGGGLDIVSGGELFRGLKAGVPPGKIVYSGVGKTPEEMDFALESGILMFNVESVAELKALDARAGALGKKAPVAIRVNPDVDPKTHPKISTGMKKNKFGIDKERAIEAYKLAMALSHVEPIGIDCHIGSQITQVSPFEEAVDSLRRLIRELKSIGVPARYLDVGGGLGISYNAETPPEPGEYARAVCRALDDVPMEIICEPGRVIVGNAGALVTRVLYRKSGAAKEFVIVDAGMNDLVRPAMYDSYHSILPAERRGSPCIVADVVGPICESSDYLAQGREIEEAREGDLLAAMSAGAYGFSMSSNYNARPRAAEVLVNGAAFHVVRQRETWEDLVRGESVPDFLR